MTGQDVLDRFAGAAAGPLRRGAMVAALGAAAAMLGAWALAALLTDAIPLLSGFALGVGAAVVVAACEVTQRHAGVAARAAASAAARSAVVEAVLPDRRVCFDGGVSSAAFFVGEVIDRLGPYYETYLPTRRALGPAAAVSLAAGAFGSVVVAALWGLAVPVLVVNLVVVGLGASAVSTRQLNETRRLHDRLLDRLEGLGTVVALRAERREVAGQRAADNRLVSATMTMLRVGLLSAAVLELVVTMAMAVVATVIGLHLLGYWTVPAVPRPLNLTVGLWLLIGTPLFFAPLRAYASAYHAREDAVAAAGLIAPLLDREPAPPPTPAPTIPDALVLSISDVRVDASVGERPVLQDIELRLAAGVVLGLTGASGAGKSTLLSLAAGLLSPTTGKATRSAAGVAWAGQRPWLGPATVAEALAVAAPEVDIEMAAHALRIVGLANTQAEAEQLLARRLGERGAGLSAGERHRLALARLVVSDAELLLLDEPTAHLDAGTEAELIPVLRQVLAGRSALIATHSPAVLAVCHDILRLERGRVVAA